MRRRLSPQEKKELSLQKDRRNAYGENDKASRKNIPRAKARVNRANRRADTVAMSGGVGRPVESLDERVDDAIAGRRRKVWRKLPDEPLRDRLARREGASDQLPFDPSRRDWH